MGWSIGFDPNWRRDVGYGVPAYCDHPGCMAEIDRGLSYVCGGQPYGGDWGCGLYFCEKHLNLFVGGGPKRRPNQLCTRCDHKTRKQPFTPTPDHPDWIRHKLSDPSWSAWRDDHPEAVTALTAQLCAQAPEGKEAHPCA